MAQYSCKFCGRDCDLKEYKDFELEMCGPCFSEWKQIERNP